MEFGTAGIRGPVTRVTPEMALTVGRAAGTDAREAGKPLVIGRDGRTTGEALVAAAEAGAISAGATVKQAGELPTPALAYASQGQYGMMLTASHNPPSDNGIKLFMNGGEYDRTAERRIERRVADDVPPVPWNEYGTREEIAPLSTYRDAVAAYARDFGEEPAFEVAVDCGNGMAAHATPQVLRALGGKIVALHANVDGHFRARESKPTPETLGDLREFVADGSATLGIAHDGDADRIVIVDGDGDVVHEDTVLAILAEYYVRRSDAANPVVVTTPNASSRIDERVAVAGGTTERVRLGALHEGVAEAEGTVVFAAEPWKHIHPAFGGWIDGVTSAAVFVRLVAEHGLDGLRDPVSERPYRKVSVTCPDERKLAAMEQLETQLPDLFPEATVDTEYGVRLTLDDGWLLVRPSGTESYLRLYAESERVDALVSTVKAEIERAASG